MSGAPSRLADVVDATGPIDRGVDAPRTRGQRPEWLRPRTWVPPIAAVGLLVLGWQLYAVHNPYVVPTVPRIFGQLGSRPGFYWQNLLVTLREAVVGAGCGMTGAFVLAVAMLHLRVLERALMPLAVMLNVTPVVAIAPGLVVAFGFGFTPKYIITGVMVFFPFLINSLVGLRAVDPQAVEFLRTLHAAPTEVLWRLRLPSSLPYLFAAARICLPLSVIGAVVAEFSAAGMAGGLGSLIETAANTSDLETVYAAVAALAVLGIGLTLAVVVLQRRLLRWHGSPDPAFR